MLTLEALFSHPDNKAVLQHLKLQRPEDVRYFEANTDGSPFDEGGQLFFHRYGRLLPTSVRCTVEIWNLLAHERTGRIFAFQQGRFTIAIRPDFSRWHVDLGSGLQGITVDGVVDLRHLGSEWILFTEDSDLDEEAAEAFLAAYELSGR